MKDMNSLMDDSPVVSSGHYVTAATTDNNGTVVLCCRCGIVAHGDSIAETITRLFKAHTKVTAQ